MYQSKLTTVKMLKHFLEKNCHESDVIEWSDGCNSHPARFLRDKNGCIIVRPKITRPWEEDK